MKQTSTFPISRLSTESLDKRSSRADCSPISRARHTLLTGLLLACIVGAIFPVRSYAQRTMPGQSSISTSVIIPKAKPENTGLSTGYGRYTSGGILTGSLKIENISRDIKDNTSTYEIHSGSVLTDCGYSHRLLSATSRSVSLYTGLNALAGLEINDPHHRLPSHLEPDFKNYSLVYGIKPTLTLETFIRTRTALILEAGLPYLRGSVQNRISPQFQLGVRFNL